jgi:hypothetical protein
MCFGFIGANLSQCSHHYLKLEMSDQFIDWLKVNQDSGIDFRFNSRQRGRQKFLTELSNIATLLAEVNAKHYSECVECIFIR